MGLGGPYGCSFLALSLWQRRCVQKSSGGGFLVCWGVDARPLPIKYWKTGFFYERNKNAAARGKRFLVNGDLLSIIVRCVYP